jgi:hypothetical protein
MQSQRLYAYRRLLIVAVCVSSLFLGATCISRAQQAVPARETTRTEPKSPDDDSPTPKRPSRPSLPAPPGARRLDPRYPVWVDVKEKAVIVDGLVCLRQGMLEMFACLRNTKEHEAIVAADTKAFLVHTGLLAVGAQAGHPAKFQPTYQPPEGTEIEIFVHWKDEKGKEQTARAQDWIRDVRTKKAMTYPFVFGGSTFWTDPVNGKQFYQAEGGDFVCVSNFGTAMLDIPVQSSQSNEELEFEAFTEKIPPVGTPVRLVFKPKKAGGGEQGAGSKKDDASKKDDEAPKAKGEAGKAEGKAK